MTQPAVLMCETEERGGPRQKEHGNMQSLFKLSRRMQAHGARADAKSATRTSVEVGINRLAKRVYNPNIVGV